MIWLFWYVLCPEVSDIYRVTVGVWWKILLGDQKVRHFTFRSYTYVRPQTFYTKSKSTP